MKVRVRVAVAASLLSVVLVASIVVIGLTVVMPRFTSAERSQVMADAQQLGELIDSQISVVDAKVTTNSLWDGLYEFIETADPEFRDAELGDAGAAASEVDGYAVFDDDGTVLYNNSWDVAGDTERSDDFLDADVLAVDGPIVSGVLAGEDVRGLFLINDAVTLVSASPAFNSAGDAPPRGGLVMARVFDDLVTAELSRALRADVALQTVAAAAKVGVDQSSFDDAGIAVQVPGSNTIVGWLQVADQSGEVIAVASVTQQRDLSVIGRDTVRDLALGGLLAGLVGCVALVIAFDRTVSGRLGRLAQQARSLDFAQRGRRVVVEGEDEIAHVAEGINSALESLDQILHNIGEGVRDVRAHAESLDRIARSVDDGASENAVEAESAASDAHGISAQIADVAAGAQTISSSIRQTAQDSLRAATLTTAANESVLEAARHVEQLGESARSIDAVVNLIKQIASQTDLLALNATIEAARAGDAGKGFAVVASEVKSLAHETSAGTTRITAQIDAIQAETHRVVELIAETSQRIAEADTVQRAIAQRVAEQADTADGISHNTAGVANNSQGISASVGALAMSAQSAGMAASDLRGAARELANVAAQLQAVVDFDA